MKQRIVLSLVCLCLFPTVALAQRTPSPEGTYLYIGWPNDGEALRCNNFRVWFGLRGMGVAPAGVDRPNTGHHHLIVDAPTPPLGVPVPADQHNIHFGGGQTEVEIELAPGEHTLQLVLGDYLHIPHDPPVVSEVIRIRVK